MKNNGKNTFFISDLHFGHAKVIEYSQRPFKDIEEMNEKLIRNWNSVVQDKDTVIVVGDFAMYLKKEKLREILSRLRGKKILVRGNHDMSPSEMLNIGFDHVCESMTVKIGNEIVNVSHYPYKKPWYVYTYYNFMNKLLPKKYFRPRKFPNQLEDDGKFLIHGHTHSRLKVKNRMINMSVEAWEYKPVVYHKIHDIIAKIKIGRYEEDEVEDVGYHE